ncbi:hypothetical protein NXY56_008281 [Leishmania guyanensis]|uniref:Coiled-coil domain-containing protein 153 n=4 Tax=Viannia TaxID=37616 RepID=A4HQJ1_LEIBR|nr:conserved hypothetical protein [Leishmania braziliensis MHOM/BR/75/M2904]KAI5691723.1 hypothetical protein MNV84_08459 [Leishmania braziliensis]CCM19930.1 hypothetical protein, conserved [Leishmania guyanensis]CAJ2482344.1 unnamed protein product [Leishmania braziliensis]CAJ2482585.1 unnamed protein product [Leishmania braziliensis]CAM44457.1 conserved hypothetical protein [Leishmania braziliensis MHOM/BR/75/M2904]
MPPKGFKKSVSPEEVIAARKEKLASLSQQCAAVEKMLAISTDQGLRLNAEIAELERRIAETEVLTERESRDLDEKVKAVSNYATSNLDQLQQRHLNMEKATHEAEAENDLLLVKIAELTERKEAELAEWEAKVEEQRAVMNQKALDFGLQLKETLAKRYATAS